MEFLSRSLVAELGRGISATVITATLIGAGSQLLEGRAFEAVLKGDASKLSGVGSGKVLGSDTNSKVFINFVDHGENVLKLIVNHFLLC